MVYRAARRHLVRAHRHGPDKVAAVREPAIGRPDLLDQFHCSRIQRKLIANMPQLNGESSTESSRPSRCRTGTKSSAASTSQFGAVAWARRKVHQGSANWQRTTSSCPLAGAGGAPPRQTNPQSDPRSRGVRPRPPARLRPRDRANHNDEVLERAGLRTRNRFAAPARRRCHSCGSGCPSRSREPHHARGMRNGGPTVSKQAECNGRPRRSLSRCACRALQWVFRHPPADEAWHVSRHRLRKPRERQPGGQELRDRGTAIALGAGRRVRRCAPLAGSTRSAPRARCSGPLRCDLCGEQLDNSPCAQIAAEGRGLLIYEHQEGRGIGLMAKLRGLRAAGPRPSTRSLAKPSARSLEADCRDFRACPLPSCANSASDECVLLSNKPGQVQGPLTDAGIDVVGARGPVKRRPIRSSLAYLRTKRDRMGHALHLPNHPRPSGDDPERRSAAIRQHPRRSFASCAAGRMDRRRRRRGPRETKGT